MKDFVEQLRKHWVRSVLNVVVVAFFLVHVSGYISFGFIERMENLAYDVRLLLTMPHTKDERIVIVDIDEKSLAEVGRWPWPRITMARMVEQLFGPYDVALVGFDVVFAEPDESSGLKVLEDLAEHELKDNETYLTALERVRPELNYDKRFAASLADRPVILGYYFSVKTGKDDALRTGQLPPPTFEEGFFRGRNIPFPVADGYGANLPELQEAAAGAGHFNPTTDRDGLVRRVPMLYEFEGDYYEALSLAMARAVLGVAQVEPVYAGDTLGSESYTGLEWLRVGNRMIPVDAEVRALVPYRGPKGSFPYVSAVDVLEGRVDPAQLQGTIALVGTSAPGLLDLRSTPVQEVYPGVEIHANLIAGIIDNMLKEKPAYTLGAEFVIVILAGILMSLTFALMGPGRATLVTAMLAATVIAINAMVWIQGNLVLPIAAGLLMIAALYLVNMSYGFFVESRGKRQLAGLFGQYVPPELVDEMSDDPDRYTLEAESRELTVLFSDVRGFTTISEGLEPRELSDLMNHFLTPLTQVIHQHRGTIDKYMGDAIMAFWGAPLPEPDHARHALVAAMEMVAKLDAMQPDFRAKGWPEVRIGVGLNTGSMSVGNMGSEFRMAYTVLGDAVNLGSRLEGLTRQYGVDIIVSESTRDAVPEYVYRELDRVRVKGKDKPVAIFEPVGLRGKLDKATRDELAIYEQALKLYRSQNWDMAELQFVNLQHMAPFRAVYKIYAERILLFRDQPPGADWDGVFTFKTK